MYEFPEQTVFQGLPVRRSQILFLFGLTAILLVALAISAIAISATRSESSVPETSTTGPAVYGWLPAPDLEVTGAAGTGFAGADAMRTGPAVYGWLPDEVQIGPAVYGWLPDEVQIGPAVYGWLPDEQAGATDSDGH